MLQNLRDAAEPLFQRQLVIAETLHQEGRFTGQIRDLPLEDLLKLLYCRDRDVANDARIRSKPTRAWAFCAALIEVLNDRRHPYRRSAQWCVLDLFEDLISFCAWNPSISTGRRGPCAISYGRRKMTTRAQPSRRASCSVDTCRIVPAAPLPIQCLQAPSAIGRRSAIHGLFHVVEWHPESRAAWWGECLKPRQPS